MKAFVISYDLNRPGQNYNSLYDTIKSLGGWWHHLDSTWLVASSMSASEIRDTIKRVLDSNDKLIVIETGKSWAATSSIPKSGTDWMYNNL